MPSRKRASSVLNGDNDDLPKEADRVTNPEDALAAAEEADAEAAEAEAVAVAARARARAIRLRREAAAAEATRAAEVAEAAAADVESSATELDEIEGVSSEADEPAVAESTAAGELTVADSDEFDESDDALTRRRPRITGRVLKVTAATLAVLCTFALLALSAGMIVQHRNVEAQRQQSAEFAAAARQSVVTLMSLDFNKAKEDVQRILDNTTGDFKKEFEGQAEDFVKVAQESKVVTEATVNAVAVQQMTMDTATVLVAVVTQVSNAASKEQGPRSWRLSVDVAREGDQIKLAKVEFVP